MDEIKLKKSIIKIIEMLQDLVEDQCPIENSTEKSIDEISYETVAKAMIELVKNINKQAAIDLLAQFNAKNLKDVNQQDYSKLLEKIEQRISK